jgi:NADH-quinone oxidoreductase subunit A
MGRCPEERSHMPTDFLPVLFLVVVAVGLSAIAILAPSLLGPRKPNKVKLATYESGKLPVGPARPRFPVHYYLLAVLFLLFDIEILFLVPWAVVFKGLSPRLVGLVEAGVFVLVLGIGLVYVWKKGGLEWE